MGNRIPSYLLQTDKDLYASANIKRAKISFLDITILNSAKTVKSIYVQAENAARENLIQKINPHVKLFALIYFAVVISVVNNPIVQLLTTFYILILYIIARLRVFQVYRKILFLAFIFGFLLILPASLNVITPGKIIFQLFAFKNPSQFWIYNIPHNIGFTQNGLQVVSLVFLRVLNSISFAMLIVFTTPFPSFIKSFKIIGVPDLLMMIISLAYKYIFILSRTIEETYFALKSRLSGNIHNKKIRNVISGRIYFIFKRSAMLYEETYHAMVSRGYNGKVKLHSKQSFTFIDFISLAIIVISGIVLLLF
jgi:cobalt/nickel transport system permease protein